ncbi:MAG: CDP-alcohol phosphatidyltransferase family protein [Vicinamibacterales bacterium]
MSWHLPPRAQRRRLVAPLVLFTVATAQVATLVSARLGLSDAYVVKALVPFVVFSVIASGSLTSSHPFDRLGPANVVTCFRLLLTGLAAGCIGERSSLSIAAMVAGITVVVTALDGLDGWLARRTGMASAFGARFDMETDAFLILVLAVLAWQHGKAGPWIVLAGAMRYLFVVAGWAWTWLDAPLPPSTRRKTVCVVQIVGLGAVVSPLLVVPASLVAAGITLAALTWSFLVDVLWLRRQAG